MRTDWVRWKRCKPNGNFPVAPAGAKTKELVYSGLEKAGDPRVLLDPAPLISDALLLIAAPQ